MTCLTKQHAQTQKFLLQLFSHHWVETGVGGHKREMRGKYKRRETKGSEKGNISLARGKIKWPETYLSKTEKAAHAKSKGSRDLLEWKVHRLFRNVLWMEFSALSGSWSAMTWLAVSLRRRRLIGCDTFHIITLFNLHSHWCCPSKLCTAAKDGWNVSGLSWGEAGRIYQRTGRFIAAKLLKSLVKPPSIVSFSYFPFVLDLIMSLITRHCTDSSFTDLFPRAPVLPLSVISLVTCVKPWRSHLGSARLVAPWT